MAQVLQQFILLYQVSHPYRLYNTYALDITFFGDTSLSFALITMTSPFDVILCACTIEMFYVPLFLHNYLKIFN